MKRAPACATAEVRAYSFPAKGYNFIFAIFDPLV